jgi:hypothetical protein
MFVLCAVALAVHAATVTKAPLKQLLIDNAQVVTDVTGLEVNSAKRLENPSGNAWIDGDGVVHQVQRIASFNGLSAVSDKDPSQGTVQWDFAYPGVEFCQLLYDSGLWTLDYERLEDVEIADGEISQEMVQYHFEARAPWSSKTVTLKRLYYSDEILLQLSMVTNVVNRIAYTNDVPKIDFSKLPVLSTNDVCSIVTNEVGGDMWIVSTNGVLVTDWRVSEICTKDDYSPSGKVWEYDIVGPGILYDGRVEPDTSPWRESRIVKQVQEAYGPADAPIGEDVFAVAELVVAPKRNALGLAMAKDVVSASEITNIVRDNIGTVWDSSLGVAWQARMHNGHLYYIAVTNKQEIAK